METEFVPYELADDLTEEQEIEFYHSELCFTTVSEFKKVGLNGDPGELIKYGSGPMDVWNRHIPPAYRGLVLHTRHERKSSPTRYPNLSNIGWGGPVAEPVEDREYLVPLREIAGLYRERLRSDGWLVRYVAVVPDELLAMRP